jgi:hypothetical protein
MMKHAMGWRILPPSRWGRPERPPETDSQHRIVWFQRISDDRVGVSSILLPGDHFPPCGSLTDRPGPVTLSIHG